MLPYFNEASYMFLLFHPSVFIFLNLFGNILKQSKLKLHCNFQQHPEGAPKAQKLSGTFEKRLENFLAVVEGQGARVGEVAVVCFPAVSTVSRTGLISTGVPILSSADSTVCRNLGSACLQGMGVGKDPQMPAYFFSS